MTALIDYSQAREQVATVWADSILPALKAFIRIPALSPAFDERWAGNGHIDEAVALAEDWCRDQAPPGSRVEVIRLAGRTPLLWVDVPGTGAGESVI